MRVILIANYRPDKQESMERFAQLLSRGLAEQGHSVQVWRPSALIGRIATSTCSGFGKWLGYIDKWIVFPAFVFAKSQAQRGCYFHICDHSNAPYLRWLPSGRASITCHDVLAIRGAEGDAQAACPASPMGRYLQRWIKKNLLAAERLAAVSHLTMDHLREWPPRVSSEQWRVIHNALNNDFHPMEVTRREQFLKTHGLIGRRYVLHVGSNLARKNRKMLLKMVHSAGDRWDGVICFAGASADCQLMDLADRLGLVDRVVNVEGPDHETLVALYSGCHALLFPSYSEGFGWPIIEAQACGAPVVASNVRPIPEVGGEAVVMCDPDDVSGFVAHLLRLDDPDWRIQVAEKGLKNSQRFTPQRMADAYVGLIQSGIT